MVKGVGTDLLKLSRVEEALERHGERFARRILSDEEYREFVEHAAPAVFLGKRFALKEAVVKALGTGIAKGISWQHLSIFHDESGKPEVRLSEKAEEHRLRMGISSIQISLSDDDGFILAFAVAS